MRQVFESEAFTLIYFQKRIVDRSCKITLTFFYTLDISAVVFSSKKWKATKNLLDSLLQFEGIIFIVVFGDQLNPKN